MKRCRPPDRRDRAGYVSLLAMSFALALAILAGGVSTGLRNYLVAAARQERDIRDQIALESAAAAVLGELGGGGSARSTLAIPRQGREVAIELSRPGGKLDFLADPDDALAGGLAAIGAAGKPVWRDGKGLADVASRLGLDPAAEDCLRRRFTFGRAPGPRVLGGAAAEDAVSVRAGDQLDIRASLSGSSDEKVVWMRARFTGGEDGWKLHDYRRLRGRATCPDS